MIFQFLSFNFILLSEMGSGVCYMVDPQSRKYHVSKLCFLPFFPYHNSQGDFFYSLPQFLSNPADVTFLFGHYIFVFLLESSEVFYKINLILRTVLDLQILKYFKICKSFFFNIHVKHTKYS